MMVCEGSPFCVAGSLGAQNCFQFDSFLASAFKISHGNVAGTFFSVPPQPDFRSGTVGPRLPHFAGPPATSPKIFCHSSVEGVVAATAGTPQWWVPVPTVYDGHAARACNPAAAIRTTTAAA